MPSSKKCQRPTALVVPHTHWDRAWFWPIERLRVRLVELFDVLLSEFRKHPEYRFTTDGQMVIVEDYLEAHPEHRAELERLGREGRLKMGPMYVLADLYCTGGEALIRNILIGRRMAGEFHARLDTLHMPDTFGIVPSIPMIAAGFGLPAFTFMRGTVGERPGMTSMEADTTTTIAPQIPSGTRMFLWSTPDGSTVRVMRLRDGYANAARLGMTGGGIVPEFDEEKALQTFLDAAARQNDEQGEPLLLLAGVDHQIPQPQLTGLMRQATKKSAFDYKYADLDDMARAMLARDAVEWPRYQGEFHGSGAASVLGGTLTSRIYLKQTNAAVERLLVQSAEPGAALASLVTGRRDPGFASLTLAWKHLLLTHPHDNICGCSVDAVHQDDEYRMRQAGDAADAVRRRAVRLLLGALGGNRAGDERYSFFLFDSQAAPRRARIRVRLDCEGRLKWGDYRLPEFYAIVDEAGREVPFCEVERGRSVEHPHQTALVEMDVALRPATVERFYVEPRRRWKATRVPKAGVLENARLRVAARTDGTFDLTDKKTGQTYTRLGVFSGQADVGDTYDFSDIPTEKERVLAGGRFRIESVAACAGLQALRMSGALRVPEASETTGRSRRMARVPVTVTLSLAAGADHVECRVAFENTARDHRLRYNLSLPFAPLASRAGLKFAEVARPVGERPTGTEAPRVHPEHPADEFVAVERPAAPGRGKGGDGIALFSEFPINYEVMPGRPPRLAVTLVRAVGFLSRGDMATRKGNAGPDTPTPEAQCLGRRFDMRFAVRPYGAKEGGALLGEAMLWRSGAFHGLIEGYDAPRAKGFEGPFFEVASATPCAPVVSALKPRDAGEGTLLRLFNPGAQPLTARLRVPVAKRLVPLGLHEEPTGKSVAAAKDGSFAIEVPPYGLRTYCIE